MRLFGHADVEHGMLPGFPRLPFTKIRPVPSTLLVLDGAPNHRCRDLVLPDNISLRSLGPYSPELNPKENVWHEIREKIFKNYALKSIDAVRAKLEQAILYLEHNPDIVKSITGFPYIIKSL